MWFTQNVRNNSVSIETFWCKNLPGAGHELLENVHLYHLCLVLKYLCFGLGSVGFGCWIGYFRKLIFSNTIKIVWCVNLTGVGHELVDIGCLGHLCLFSKYWRVRLVRVGFGCLLGDFLDSTFFNIITAENMFLLDGGTVLVILFKWHERRSN